MDCCRSSNCTGTDRFFSKWSRSYARRFRRKGLERVQEYLLEGIRREPVEAREVLDIGCGIGGLHMALLEQGASRATGIDLAEGMLKQAQTIAEERGLQDRASYVHGDFVERSDSLPDADITLLDKVVCCYDNLESLIARSTRKTRRLYGLIYPRNALLPRWIFKAQILFSRLIRMQFRPYWHDWEKMTSMIVSAGFRPLFRRDALLWSVAVFERVPA